MSGERRRPLVADHVLRACCGGCMCVCCEHGVYCVCGYVCVVCVVCVFVCGVCVMCLCGVSVAWCVLIYGMGGEEEHGRR